MMKTIIYFLQNFGLWSRLNSNYSNRKIKFLTIGYVLFLVGPSISCICTQSHNVSVAMKAILELIIFIRCISVFTFALMSRPIMEQIYTDMRHALTKASQDSHEDVQSTVRHLEVSSEILIKVYMGSEMVAVVFYSVLLPLIALVKYVTGTERALAVVFAADYLLFDVEHNFWLWLPVTLFTILATFNMAATVVATDSFNWCTLYHISCLFRIVQMKIGRLDDYRGTDLYQAELVEIVILQQIGYRCARQMDRILYGMLLVLYGGCIFCLCLSMVVLTVARDDGVLVLKMVIVLVYIILLIFTYSMVGTELMTTSLSIADAVYSTCWYECPVPQQHSISIIIMRSQNMAALTAGKLFLVSRASFAMVLRNAYSWYTILGQVYDI